MERKRWQSKANDLVAQTFAQIEAELGVGMVPRIFGSLVATIALFDQICTADNLFHLNLAQP